MYEFGNVRVIGEDEPDPGGLTVRLLPAKWDLHYYPWWKSTTAECAEAIPDCTGLSVLDFGCGATAIQALVAAKRGAKRVVAIDRQASLIKEAERQVRANKLQKTIICVVGTEPQEKYDYAIANVGDAALVGMVSRWATHGHGTDTAGEIIRW